MQKPRLIAGKSRPFFPNPTPADGRMSSFPKYKDLKRPDETGLPLSWGTWGPEDQVGTLNNITPETVVEAARQVKRGVRFNLDLPLHFPFGEVLPNAHHGGRRAPEQTLIVRNRDNLLVRDDKLDDFWLQGSSQWDGLTHMGDAGQGFYNGVREDQVTQQEGTDWRTLELILPVLLAQHAQAFVHDVAPVSTGSAYVAQYLVNDVSNGRHRGENDCPGSTYVECQVRGTVGRPGRRDRQ